MLNVALCMRIWHEVRNFASQKFRLTRVIQFPTLLQNGLFCLFLLTSVVQNVCVCTAATSPVVLRWVCDSPRTGCAWRITPLCMWREQAIIEWSRRVISIVACCHGAKLCAHAIRDFRSQQYYGLRVCGQKYIIIIICDRLQKSCATVK